MSNYDSSSSDFLAYHEPTLTNLLTLLSFLLFLSAAEWFSDRFLKAGLIGQIAVGIIYGAPLGNLLPTDWQTTFVSLGYLGLILIIFEGGLTVRLDLLRKYFWLSLVAASIGVATPIGLSYLVMYLGFGHEVVETFIVGAALSTTSLGTTFVTIGSAARGFDFSHTKVGIVLISAAVLDDVSGLVMASVTSNLGELADGGDVSIGWLIGRPVVASLVMAVLSPVLSTLLFSPLFRRYLEHHLPRFGHVSNLVLMSLILCAYTTVAYYAGTSVLFGSFLAGTLLNSLPSTHPDGPFVEPTSAVDEQSGEQPDEHDASSLPRRAPIFRRTLEAYIGSPLKYILQPLFFASMGFAIPFKRLWTGKAIWHGVVFSLAMMLGKLAVGLLVPLWDACMRRPRLPLVDLLRTTAKPALLLGMAMVPRGEIGLIIIQIGFNTTPFLSEEAFITAAWAIVLNTIIGPAVLGALLRWYGREAASDERWGVRRLPDLVSADIEAAMQHWGWWKRWTNRTRSRSVTVDARSRPSEALDRDALDQTRDLEGGGAVTGGDRSQAADEPEKASSTTASTPVTDPRFASRFQPANVRFEPTLGSQEAVDRMIEK